MKCYKVVLSKGTYNLEDALEIPVGVIVAGVSETEESDDIITVGTIGDLCKADYVCDGIADEVEIQAALDLAEAKIQAEDV